MRTGRLLIGTMLCFLAMAVIAPVSAQGDQILDGIGEAVEGEESLTITGWINPGSARAGQLFFDFGKGANSHFYAAPTGSGESEGLLAAVVTGGESYLAASSALPLNRWSQLAIVVNVASGKLTTYHNGTLVSERSNMAVSLNELFAGAGVAGETNNLYIGRSPYSDKVFLNARLYDFRIYRIPLTEPQVSRIYYTALKGGEQSAGRRGEKEQSLPGFPETTPQLYTVSLTAIPDISVETATGHLPQLPRYVKGIYAGNADGPDVRVIWPSPDDNSQVLHPGTYTVTGRVAGTTLEPKAVVTVREAGEPATPGRRLEQFRLDQVSLESDLHHHSTKFIENRDKFLTGLAKTNPDDFLYMFRNAFGQEQPAGARPLGGWDSQQTKLRGHASGHYLTALAQAYAGSGYDPSLRAQFAHKMEYMVNILHELSQLSGRAVVPGDEYVSDPLKVPPAQGKGVYNSDLSSEGIRTDYWNWGTGFISAYPPDQFIMLESGATYGGSDNQIWAPYYTLHKIVAGLMDIYEVTGNSRALEVVRGMGDWVHQRLSRLPEETLISMWNRYIAGEFGGMNEAMARLSRLTGDRRYLETAQLFDNIKLFFGDADHSHGLARNVDMMRGLHANQHIPQIVGALEIYRNSDASDYFHIADNFWQMAASDYMYSIGGVAGASNPPNAECFTAQPATLYENGFAAGGQNETCATYNMLKLAGGLFLYDQRGELMDYYERALYNHILASVAEHNPANTYHVPLRPGSVKQFGNPEMNGFTCCNGTALESNTKLQNSIYFRSEDNSALYINLYIPSTLTWSERGVTVRQETAYPGEDRTRLTIGGKGRFNIHVRVPGWATKGFFVTINGKKIKTEVIPGSYLSLNRKWKDGDLIELEMPFSFRLEPVMDQQNIASLFWGPVLLAAQEETPLTEWRKVTLDANDIGRSITGDPASLEFMVDDTVFRPFNDTYGRHSVYLDVTLK
jgi:DUF1680 family protein